MKDYDALLKIVFIGDHFAGKTTLLRRIAQDQFYQQHLATIGVDFKIKNYEIKNKKFKVQFWDTAGQERFRSIQAPYYRGADAVIICYNLNDANSFNSLQNWLKETETYTKGQVPAILVGCKKDLQIQVPTDAIVRFLEKRAILHFQTSSKTGEGVQETVRSIVQECGMRKLGMMEQKNNNVQVRQEVLKKPSRIQHLKKACC